MEQSIKNKIILLNDLVDKVANLQKADRIVVQSHGIFDLIHPGIITHLNDAKKQGDILIITVIKDKDVRKGSGRPIFPENFRAENVASLEQVDYVCIVDDATPFECINRIKPDVFAKGKSYKERDRKIHEKIFQEEKMMYFENIRIHETDGFSFSSSQIINNFIDVYPEEVKVFLNEFSQRYDFDYIVEKLNEIRDMKILLIGDGIIDEYYYCESMGKSPKAQLVVNKYVNHEVFAGGSFAIANHIAGLCDNVHLIALLGKEDLREEFITDNLKPNINTEFFYREDGPTIIKRRYINQYQNQKIFEINYINDSNISQNLESKVIGYLKSIMHEYDLILVSDFGHGFITNEIIRIIEKYARKVAVNAQTNGSNAGYNLITKYHNTNFICLDAPEARLATQEKYAEVEDIAKKLLGNINTDYLIITMGSAGSFCISSKHEINRTPAFATKVVDIIGAGDAFFAFTAPCFAAGMSMDMVSFIGNTVGALAVQIEGNKKSVEKHDLLEFVHTILK